MFIEIRHVEWGVAPVAICLRASMGVRLMRSFVVAPTAVGSF